MRRTRLLAFACALQVALAAEVPAGTDLHIRLVTRLATDSAQPGQKVDAVVIAPALTIPPGARISGTVRTVERVTGNESATPASLELNFNTIEIGKLTLPLAAEVREVDNARESVEPGGRIVGINPHDAITTRIDQGLNKLKGNDKLAALAGILEVVKDVAVKDTDPNIAYEPGTEITLRLTAPLNGSLPAIPVQPTFPTLRGVTALVNHQPFQTYGQGSRRPSDITNVMFIGSREQVESAFAEAGWSGATALNGVSKFETAIAIIEQRGFKEAPVSMLTLANRPPDLVFQKGNNTFAQRHHLRMWRSADTYQGREVWLCSSTHDTGIDYSQRDMTFIHKIDSNIDIERAKVMNDILFTGKVRSVAMVPRPDVPRHAQNATGDEIDTDGSMAVLLLK